MWVFVWVFVGLCPTAGNPPVKCMCVGLPLTAGNL